MIYVLKETRALWVGEHSDSNGGLELGWPLAFHQTAITKLLKYLEVDSREWEE